jgi:uncharacterized membrane protein YjjP (DUF1212 family)
MSVAAASPSPTGPTPAASTPTDSSSPPPSPTTSASTSPTGTDSTSPTPSSSGSPTTTPSGTPTASHTETPAPTPTPRPTHSTTVPVATKPAAATSDLPPATIVVAVVVLVAAAVVLLVARRRARAAVPLPDPAPLEASDPATMVTFLSSLGEAMIDSGDPVTHVQDSLRRVAHANHVSAGGIVVLPTALIVSLPGENALQTSVTVAGTSRLRLDQIDEVFALSEDAAAGAVRPRDGLARLTDIRTRPEPYPQWLSVVGHAVLTAGLAIILGGTLLDVAVAAALGVAVGVGHAVARRYTIAYEVFVPVVSSFAVALVVFLLPRTGLDVGVAAPLIAPLVMFLPGALLTTSVIELATGQMVSGASRLAAGAMQLTLLALGILVAAQLVGVPAGIGRSEPPFGDLAPWVGVAVFGVGLVVHRSARRESTGWILLVLYVAYAGQVIGGFLLGGTLSAFVGAFLMTPVAVYVARLRSGPSVLVSFLPAFWLLVPGALGLVGLTQVLAEHSSGMDSLLTAGATMLGIAFGVLLGLAAASGMTTMAQTVALPWGTRERAREEQHRG